MGSDWLSSVSSEIVEYLFSDTGIILLEAEEYMSEQSGFGQIHWCGLSRLFIWVCVQVSH